MPKSPTPSEPAADNATPTTAAEPGTDSPGAEMVQLRCIGSFHEAPNFGGRLLQAGDIFSADKARAVELRASGLVAYADDKAEADAANPTDALTETPSPAITSASIRRRS